MGFKVISFKQAKTDKQKNHWAELCWFDSRGCVQSTAFLNALKVNEVFISQLETRHRTTEHHLPYGITQC